MIKKKLLIVSTSFNYFDKRFNDNQFDVLSISISHQFYLKNKNINYLTLENYFDNEHEEKLYGEFNKSLNEWLFESDELLKQNVGLDHAYSGNGFWFVHRFSELFYIQNVVNKISRDYQGFELITDKKYSEISEDYTSRNPSFTEVFGNQELRIERLIFHALSIRKLKFVTSSKKYSKIKTSLFYNYSWLKSGIQRKFRELLYNVFRIFIKKNKLFLTLQDGYDLEILKNKLLDLKFTNIKRDILNDLYDAKKQKIFIDDNKLKEASLKFFTKYLPSYISILKNILQNYNLNIVSQLNQLDQVTESAFINHSADGLVLPMCSQDIFDFYIVKYANKKNIPVYFMKHNGVIESFKSRDLFKEYLHQNKYLQRVQFVHSEIENEEMKKINHVKTVTIRSIGIEDIMTKQKNPKKIRLLLAFGSPSHYTLKDLGSITFDTEKINFLNKIISLCERYQFELHVKLHPRGSKQLLYLFEQIKKKNSFMKNVKIIIHEKIESLFYKYDTIIMDTLFSLAVSNALYTNKNIIVYCPRKRCIKENLYNLITKRINLIHNLTELDNVFIKLYNNDLKYITNNEFNDKISINMTLAIAIQKFRQIFNSN